VPATATICFGARTTHESKSTIRFADDATARTASSIVSRFATRRTAEGRSTTYASGLDEAYASMRSSHSFLCGDDAGTFWSTTSKGWPACEKRKRRRVEKEY
jgi:hypothetical protein